MDEEPRWTEPRHVDWSRYADIGDASVVVQPPQTHFRRVRSVLWRATLAVGAALYVAGVIWSRHAPPDARASAPGVWNVELSATGTAPVTALAYGQEAGLHLVRIPGRDAPVEERRRIPVRLAAGNVYLVSLGWDGLNVHSTSPAGAPRVALSAQARFVTLFQSPRGTGISTSWREAP